MKWKQLFFTIVLNIFLMLMMSIFLEYSNLTERFVSVEDTVQEALDLAISASVHSEEFFTEKYQNKLMSYAGVGSYGNDQTAAATTLVFLQDSGEFEQLNTYQFAEWYQYYRRLPRSSDINEITRIGEHDRYGLVGHVFEWLYGRAGSSYNSAGLAYANRNSAKQFEYYYESLSRGRTNSNFCDYYQSVGHMQQTTGYLKAAYGSDSYKLQLMNYPVLANMGLDWMDGLNSADSTVTSDNLCSSLHVGKSRLSQLNTYYFLTPASLGVTYIPVEVLKPVLVANMDTIVRLNRLGQTSKEARSADAIATLKGASNCVNTSVYDYNLAHDAYENMDTEYLVDADGHAVHIKSDYEENIVTDGLVEYDLSTLQVKVDYFYHDFSDMSEESAKLISKLNGTLTPDGAGGVTGESALRMATLQAFIDQDTSEFVSSFGGASFYNDGYKSVSKGRVIARVTAKVKVHVPYQSAILQWASYMFTGTKHFDIKRFDPDTGQAFHTVSDSDGLWYQYTTYFCSSRS